MNPAEDTSAQSISARWRPLGFILFSIALIIPVWLVRYPPLLDYPNHLASSFVLAHLHDSTFRFGEFYSADWGPYPYLAMDVILRGLQWILPILVAGKFYLSLCVVALPLTAAFFLRQANPGEDLLPSWSLLVVHNIFFLYGFINFYLSLSVCLFALGLWLRWLARRGPARWYFAAAAVTALYFTHLIGFAIAGVVVTAYSIFARRKLREIMFSWALFLPGVIFYLIFSRVGAGRQTVLFHGWEDKLDALLSLVPTDTPWLDRVLPAAIVFAVLLAWWKNPELHWNRPWLGVAATLFVLFWIMPWAYGDGSDLDIRLLPMLFVVLLAIVGIGRARGTKLLYLLLVLLLAREAVLVRNFYGAQPELDGLARSFAATERNARVLPIVEDPDDDTPLHHTYAHFWAYGVIERGWFSPYLFEAKGVLPLRIQQDSYTPDGFWDLKYPDALDWTQVKSGYDYVWAYNVPRFDADLAKIGTLVYQSGKLHLYRIKKPPTEP